MTSLYDDASLYDLVAPHDPVMERFYIDTVGGPGKRVLELACGSGRFTLPVAASGADVVGGDLSPIMLESGRQKAAAQGVSVSFVELDMRDFDLARTFDSIFIAANSLLHLLTDDDFTRAFASIRRHMTPRTELVFDVFVPSARNLGKDPDERQPLGVFRHAEMGEVTVEETVDYNPVDQVSRSNWYWSTPGRPDFRQTSVELRHIYPKELPLLLRQNGLRLSQRYGSFARDPFTRDSWRQVCIATLSE